MKFRVRNHPYLFMGALLGAGLCILVLTLLFFDKPREALEMLYERPRIERAMADYFAAEMSRDYAKVYHCLAPSSHYRRTHSYEEFLADMKSNPVRIVSYKIVDIYGLRKNHDPKTYPDVERFAQVEVDVTLKFGDTKREVLCNYCFTFLKEKGTWRKG